MVKSAHDQGANQFDVRMNLESHVLNDVHIVMTTLGTAGNRVLEGADKFEVVVVDEAVSSTCLFDHTLVISGQFSTFVSFNRHNLWSQQRLLRYNLDHDMLFSLETPSNSLQQFLMCQDATANSTGHSFNDWKKQAKPSM